MSDQIIRGAEVKRPATTPLKSTILDHATVVTNDRFGLRNNEGLWPSYNCMDTLVPTPLCPKPLADKEYKTFSFAKWVPAFEFAVHGGVQCLAIGLDKADQKAEIARVFGLNEAKGVERALLETRFALSDPSGDPHPTLAAWPAPIDLTSSGVNVLGALATLEGYAATVYAGVPTIHAPRAAVLMLMALGAIVETDGKFYTKTGAKVACGGGYDSDETPTGVFTLYATGEVYVERSSEIGPLQSIVVPGDGSGTGSDQNGIAENSVVTLVERPYRVGVDCFVAKVTARAWEVPL